MTLSDSTIATALSALDERIYQCDVAIVDDDLSKDRLKAKQERDRKAWDELWDFWSE